MGMLRTTVENSLGWFPGPGPRQAGHCAHPAQVIPCSILQTFYNANNSNNNNKHGAFIS